MEYMILEAGDHAEMAVKVNKAITAGWKPQGSIAAYTVMERDGYDNTFYNIWFMQAMTKETGK
jgi:hypothetical protein